MLTPDDLREIKAIIERYHTAFIANWVDVEALAPELRAELERKGLLDPQLATIEDAYLYGALLAALEDKASAKMGLQDFHARLRKDPLPLSAYEREAVKWAGIQAAEWIVGLGNRIGANLTRTLINEDLALEARTKDMVRDKTALNLARRETVGKLKSDMGWATKDWARDWDRISVTEKQNSLLYGQKNALREQYGDPLVFRRPMPDACADCKKLLAPSGLPRVFRLSALEGNGTNFGRKRADWQPVVGAIHPHCFPGDQRVLTERGYRPIAEIQPGDEVIAGDGTVQRVSKVWSYLYDGEAVTISGGDLWSVTSTPDHHFLTPSGWRAAQEIEQGGDIRGYVRHDGRLIAEEIEAVQSPVVRSEDGFLARVLFGFTGAGVPVAAVDFKGELFVWEAYIDRAKADGEIEDTFQLGFVESIVDQALIGGARLTDAGLETVCDISGGPFAASDGCVSCGRQFLTFRRCGSAEAERLRFADAARLDPQLQESTSDGIAGDAKSAGYELLRELLIYVEPADQSEVYRFGVHRVFPSPTIEKYKPSLHCGVSVRKHRYKGMIYDLEIPGVHAYVVNGLTAHNCQCPLSRMPAGWGFDEETGDLVPGGKLPEVYETWDELERALRAEDSLRKSARRTGLTEFQGLPIYIENPVGSERNWAAPDGSQGTTRMLNAYGYVKGTNGLDDDEVDVYLGPDPRAPMVYVIDQQDPPTGRYDEQKCMLGFPTEAMALEAYRAHMDAPARFELGVQGMDLEAFKRWLQASRARPGEMGKSDLALVIDLEKARVRPEHAARGDEHYGDRAPSGNMGGFNLEFGVPPQAPPPNKVDPERDLHLERKGPRLKNDLEGYRPGKPYRQEPRPIEVDETYALGEDERAALVEHHRTKLEDEYEAHIGPQNHATGVRRGGTRRKQAK